MRFLLILILLPIIEIYFFVKIGTEIGAFSTILFTLATAFLGIAVIKYQGLSSFMQARQSVMNTNQPGIEIFSNLALFISGAFFLVPGFFTDFIGFLILIPFTRKIIFRITIRNKNEVKVKSKHDTIDGEIVDEKKDEL